MTCFVMILTDFSKYNIIIWINKNRILVYTNRWKYIGISKWKLDVIINKTTKYIYF